MRKLALGLAGALVAVTFLASALTSAPAEAQQKKKKPASGEQCRAACEADLRARGLWTKMPYGTCRRRCGMPV
jgi:hypothetical protein